MKKTLTVIGLLAGALGVHAQSGGSINWESYQFGHFSISIWSVDPSAPTTSVVGNGSADIPSGSTTYGSSVLLGGTASGAGPGAAGNFNGNNYTVGLYVGSSASAVAAAVLGGSPNATASIVSDGGAGAGGYWAEGGPILYNNAGAFSSTVFVELAAWYSAGGAGSFAAAVQAGVPAGHDNASSGLTLNSAVGTPPTMDGIGIQSFNLTTVPEPSTIALGVIGASSLLFRRRK